MRFGQGRGSSLTGQNSVYCGELLMADSDNRLSTFLSRFVGKHIQITNDRITTNRYTRGSLSERKDCSFCENISDYFIIALS